MYEWFSYYLFKNGWGLHHDEPIFPLHFNFMVDSFSCILNWVLALLLESAAKLESIYVPFLLDGDFNHIRFPWDKSKPNFSWSKTEGFNDFIINFALHELHRYGARITWSNIQLELVCSVLDTVFSSPDWDVLYRRSSLVAEFAIGSNHTLLLLDSQLASFTVPRPFRFDVSWLLIDGFS